MCSTGEDPLYTIFSGEGGVRGGSITGDAIWNIIYYLCGELVSHLFSAPLRSLELFTPVVLFVEVSSVSISVKQKAAEAHQA